MNDIERLKALCEKYPELEIRREDSYKAGNCTWGTAEFVNEHFPDRDGETVSVRELARFIRIREVRDVLWYKLRSLADPVFYIWYRRAHGRRWSRLAGDGYDTEVAAEPDKLKLQLEGNDVQVLQEGQEPE